MTINLGKLPAWIMADVRQLGAWAAVLYPLISYVSGTPWGAKQTVWTIVGGALLTAEHVAASATDPATSINVTQKAG